MTSAIDGNFFASLIELKNGDKEFLFCGSGTTWLAAIGNKSQHVSLGEAITYSNDAADFSVEGSSPMTVLLTLRQQLIAAKGGAA